MLTTLLETHGHTIVGEAAHGLQAVERSAELHPDLITMDLDMPVLNGPEAIERIRALGNCPPIVVVSGTSSRNRLSQALAAGACWYVSKLDAGSHLPAVVATLACAEPGVQRHTNLFTRRRGGAPAGYASDPRR